MVRITDFVTRDVRFPVCDRFHVLICILSFSETPRLPGRYITDLS